MNSNKKAFLDMPLTNADVERLTHKLHEAGLVHSCLTCRHFAETGGVRAREIMPYDSYDFPPETCKLYMIRPPARVIAYGCPSWEDSAPF